MLASLVALSTVLFAAPAPCDFATFERVERRIPATDPGVELFIMRVSPPEAKRRGAVVFMHGAGGGGSSIWDIRYGDYSLMRYLACRGFDTFAVDVRGFGGSTMPRALGEPAEANPPVVRASVAVRDVGAVVGYATRTASVAQVDLVAWSWGCVVSGMYAGTNPKRVRRLVLYAPVYDRRRPKRHKTATAWREAEKAKIVGYYDPKREERPVWVEHIDSMFRFSDKGILRIPNGPLRDVYGPDAPVWDASRVRAPTLVIRGDRDPASLEEPVRQLMAALTRAASKRYVLVPGASHFLPREHKYRELQRLLGRFLSD